MNKHSLAVGVALAAFLVPTTTTAVNIIPVC